MFIQCWTHTIGLSDALHLRTYSWKMAGLIRCVWHCLSVSLGEVQFWCNWWDRYSWRNTKASRGVIGWDTKIWLVTKAGDHFTHPPGFNQVIIALFFSYIISFPTILHIVQILSSPKNLFFFSYFPLLFFYLDWLILSLSFFFPLVLIFCVTYSFMYFCFIYAMSWNKLCIYLIISSQL